MGRLINFAASLICVIFLSSSAAVSAAPPGEDYNDERTNSEFISDWVSQVDEEFDKDQAKALERAFNIVSIVDWATTHCYRWRDVDFVFARSFITDVGAVIWKRSDQVAIQRASVKFENWVAQKIAFMHTWGGGYRYGGTTRELCYDAYYPNGVHDRLFLGAPWPPKSMNGR